MKPIITVAAIAVLAGGAASCRQELAPPAPTPTATVSDAEANRIADGAVAAWSSMDAGRIKALYAPGIVGFDVATPALATDRAAWDRTRDAFAAARLNAAEVIDRRVQPLGPDSFVLSGRWKLTSKDRPANDTTIRCTDVFHRDAAGNWPIVNEHCSADPRPA